MNSMYYFWLTTVDGIGIKRTRQILRHFGTIENAWEGSLGEFKNIKGISPSLANKIIERRNKDRLLEEIGNIRKKGINIVAIDGRDYPVSLRNIYDPPFVIYIKGQLRNCRKNMAVVGSRRCTSYGKMVSRNISKLLCEYDVGIISGMARGIDTEAHIGALNAGGFTCAVLGCGCDVVYPPENHKLMLQIVKNGAVISEYPPGTRPLSSNFPARNRIISGLSDGVLIVEAGEKSGALITADFAVEQGRDVFAVPGSILSGASRGANLLIKDGAKPVTDVSDILYELGINYQKADAVCGEDQFNSGEKVLIGVINDSPIQIDDLMERVSLRISEVNSILTSLELKGAIRILPGKYIVRMF